MRANWLFASAIFLLSASVHAVSPVDGLNENPSDRLVFALDPFAEPIGYSVLDGDAKGKVLCRFGEPIEQEVSTVPTRFPGETYFSYVLRYKDLSFTIGKWPDRDHSWIESVEILGNAYELKSGIRIGSTREEVAAAFSPPEHYAQANPMKVSASIFEKQSDVGEDGITINSSGSLYKISFEFDADDRVSKVSISSSSD
jgi:hypothetical protein